jgi:hypothetical protein
MWLTTMHTLGRNMAWLMKAACRGEGGIILRRDLVITASLVFFFRS